VRLPLPSPSITSSSLGVVGVVPLVVVVALVATVAPCLVNHLAVARLLNPH
jgi:hypothetical protein